jgi:hypothetical protein
MSDTVRIRLSLGLLVVAVVHAILVGVVFTPIRWATVRLSNGCGSQTLET